MTRCCWRSWTKMTTSRCHNAFDTVWSVGQNVCYPFWRSCASGGVSSSAGCRRCCCWTTRKMSSKTTNSAMTRNWRRTNACADAIPRDPSLCPCPDRRLAFHRRRPPSSPPDASCSSFQNRQIHPWVALALRNPPQAAPRLRTRGAASPRGRISFQPRTASKDNFPPLAFPHRHYQFRPAASAGAVVPLPAVAATHSCCLLGARRPRLRRGRSTPPPPSPALALCLGCSREGEA
mmetsp:Transcript_35580/g.75979  ORF Transcript_35580/g.75979 Transcript_35580/m.75979 type:complete len:234 (-) Transcript_35580:1102-1803(-)